MHGEGLRSIFDEFREQGVQAIEAGRIEEAATFFDRALAWAREQGDGRQIDLAVCNRAAAAIDLGRGEGELPRLREILMRNGDPVNCRVAAYNIARHYELAKSYKKALFYARIARERSEALGRRDWLASSYNLIGNTLLAESFVEQASEEYEQALALMPEEPSLALAGILDNLGYCRILQGRRREGYTLLYRSLHLMRRLGNEQHEATVRLDLCFAHLETGRNRSARHQGMRALEIAEKLGNTHQIKNALYLVGEVESLEGNVVAARAHFTRLQREFFPEASYLPGFLLAVDVRNLVNLHA
ncbi:MAG TPA: tetratricopeptide repeat protein [Thermoanaerobaculia bacterium]|nr:tetratricopeptide repeat protein [Thermoanaerobaculia bacterium]